MEQLLPAHESSFVEDAFNRSTGGNFRDEATGQFQGANILNLSAELGEDSANWEPIRQRLLDVRSQRIRPGLDDKVLTDWNGLMIAAMAKAARAFDDPQLAATAANAADFFLDNMIDGNGRLLHRYREGEAALTATTDDYAFFVWGLLELYEATFDIRYLESAITLNDQFLEHFWDEENGGFYFTADDAEVLLTRSKEIYDGAIPSGNSVAMLNLLRLSRMTGNTEYEERAAALSRAFAGNVQQAPSGHTFLMTAVDFAVGPSFEIVIAGEPDAADTQAMLAALRQEYVPNKVVLLRTAGEDAPIAKIASFTEFQYAINDQATAYVCLNFYCERPTNDIETMLELIRK